MSQHFRYFGDMLKVLAQSLRPAERLTVSQAAAKYRYLREATHTGYWDNSIAPYLVGPMDVLASLDHDAMVLVSSARSGKTDIFFNYLAYCEICDPGDMMMIHMTQSSARDWSQGDLRKAFRHSKKLGERVIPGKQNMNTHDVRFMSGMRLLIKWPSISELSGKTLRRGWASDYDRMPLDVDKEGSVFGLLRKRTQTYGRNGMTGIESSPGFEINNHRWIAQTPHEAPPTEGILDIYNKGDRRRWYWRCGQCDEPFEGDFKHFDWDKKGADGGALTNAEMADTVRLVCPHCGFPHTHDPDPDAHPTPQPGKVGLNRGGKWIADGQVWQADGTVTGKANGSMIASFWLKGVSAAFLSWREMLLKYLDAMDAYERTGDTGLLKNTVNLDQGHPFLPPALAGDRSPEDLKARAAGNRWGTPEEPTVPDGVRYLTATVDVQKGRFEVAVIGHGVNGDRYLIERFSIRKSERLDEDGERYPLRPGAHVEDWYLLIPHVIERTYPLDDGSGRRMKIKASACDSGGYEGTTANAYAFFRYLRNEHPGQHHQRFTLLKGDKNQHAPRAKIGYPDSERKDRRAAARGEVPLLMLNVNLLKDQLDGLLEREGKAGEIHFNEHLADSNFSELTVEIKVPNKGWENPKSLRNETWDLLVYDIGLCLSRFIGEEQLKPDNMPSWAAEWDDNDLVFLPTDARADPFEVAEKDVTVDMKALARRFAP